MLDYTYFQKNYEITAVDLSKQQALCADLTAMQQINFTGNIDQDGNKKIFFITEEATEALLDSSQGTMKVL